MSDHSQPKLVIDIETGPAQDKDNIDWLVQGMTPPANYKSDEAIEKWMLQNKDSVISKTALSGLWGSVIAIGYAIDDEPVQVHIRDNEPQLEDEQRFLTDVLNLIHDKCAYRPQWIGFNLGFDTRFLFQRCAILGVQTGLQIPKDESPWSDRIYDVLWHWAGRETKGNSLNNVCKAFGLPTKPMKATELFNLWLTGDFDRIEEYSRHDVTVTRQLYKRINAA